MFVFVGSKEVLIFPRSAQISFKEISFCENNFNLTKLGLKWNKMTGNESLMSSSFCWSFFNQSPRILTALLHVA